MIDTFFLVLTRKGATRFTRNRPKLKASERAVKLTLNVDDKLWQEILPEAEFTVTTRSAFIEPASVEVQAEVPAIKS